MTINKLNDYAIKIYLDKNDMDRFDINFAYIDTECIKNLILILSDEINELLGIVINNEKLYVEVFSKKNRMSYFYFMFFKNFREKTYKKKHYMSV